MQRIVVVSASPLLADGVAAALRGDVPGRAAAQLHTAAAWEVRLGHVADDADAWVMAGQDITVRGASGATAQLAVGADAARLRAAVAAVLEGLSVRERPWSTGAGDEPDGEPLTPRELEVFELLGKGLSNRDIAGVLGVSAHTAKYHVGQILGKVGAATRAEAVSQGLRRGWIGL
jgi:DNA-binding NarL/FixJ family response regulator